MESNSVVSEQQISEGGKERDPEDVPEEMEDPMAENLRQGMDAVAESFDALYTLLNYAREENQQRQAEEGQLRLRMAEEDMMLEAHAEELIHRAQELVQSVSSQWHFADPNASAEMENADTPTR